jgi:isochorismate synthase EntC
VISPRPFHLVNCLDNLRQRHPDCYTFPSAMDGESFYRR